MLHRLRERWWRLAGRIDGEDGLTLVEVLIAGFVLTVAVLALASVASASLVSVRDSRERDRGTAVASSALEAVRAMEYDEIALATGDGWTDDPLVDPTGDGGHELHLGEGGAVGTIWARSGGGIDPYRCSSAEPDGCWFDIPTETNIVVRTFVTWHPDAVLQAAKRITVLAQWDDPAFTGTRTVRMSTLVTAAERGASPPAFEVRPSQASFRLDDEHVRRLAEDQDEECLEHTLTNFGAEDGYALAFDDGFVAQSPMTAGTWQNDEWVVRAFFVPVDSDLERGDPGTLMRAVEAGGHPVSDEDLAMGESARAHLCYSPRTTDGTPQGTPLAGSPYQASFTHTFQSRFDDRIAQAVEQTLAVTSDTFVLYLQDPRLLEAALDEDLEPQSAYRRTVKSGGGGGYSFDQFPMTTWAPTFSGIRDYDVGIRPRPNTEIDFHDDADVVPDTRLHNRRGLWLPSVDISFDGRTFSPGQFAAVFDHQFPGGSSGMTFAGDADVRLWGTRWPAEESDPAEGEICVGVDLLRLRSNGNVDGVVGRTFESAAVVGGWIEIEPVIPWEPGGPGTGPGEVTFDRGEYVRLRVWNAATAMNDADAERNCVRNFHIGYGTSDFPAHLRAEPAG